MRGSEAPSGRLLRAFGCTGRPTRARRARRLLTLTALGLLAVAVAPGGATAVIVHLPGGATVSYLRVPGTKALNAMASKAPVTYHEGPVMSSNTNYTLYWDPGGAPAFPAGFQAGVDRYFEDLAHDSGGVQNTDSVLTQYRDSAGEFANYDSHFAGALTDTDPYPTKGCAAAAICLSDAQIRAEIAAFVEAHKLPADLTHEYFLLTPPGVESCLDAKEKSCSDGTSHPGFCAYHGFIKVAAGVVIYADDPYVAGLHCNPGEQLPNENPSDAAIAGGLAHEHSESVTDPELNAWYDAKGAEVADKCRTGKAKTEFGEALGLAPDGAEFNQLINGDRYRYQQEWSDQAGGCVQRTALLPAVTKLTPKAGPTGGGTTVTITGSGFSSPAVVRFGGLPASEVTVNSAGSITALSPAHVAGTVDVTVTTLSATSPTVKKDHFKYK